MPGKDHLYDKRGSAVFTPWYELKSEVNVGETDLKYIEMLRKKLFSDIIHTSSLMLIVLIIWCKNCLVSSRNCRTWRLLSSWWNSWTLKRQIKKLIFHDVSKLCSGIQRRVPLIFVTCVTTVLHTTSSLT